MPGEGKRRRHPHPGGQTCRLRGRLSGAGGGEAGGMRSRVLPQKAAVQRRRMEPGPAFDMWRDYLGLAAVLATLPQERREAGEAKTAAAAGTAEVAVASASPGKALCAFCKHNGEAKHVWSGHNLRDASGRVLCPVLRSYVCPQCGATQDRAHTKRFCPLTHRGYTSVYSHSPRNAAGTRPARGRTTEK